MNRPRTQGMWNWRRKEGHQVSRVLWRLAQATWRASYVCPDSYWLEPQEPSHGVQGQEDKTQPDSTEACIRPHRPASERPSWGGAITFCLVSLKSAFLGCGLRAS